MNHWISLAPGMAIQALLAERDGEQRVYVVTEMMPPEYHWIHDRWPRLRKVVDLKLSPETAALNVIDPAIK